MKIIDRHIGKAVIGGALLVLAVLLSLFMFTEFIGEFDVIGQGDYHAWQALQYVAFSVPHLAYDLMPLAALLGSLIGLGLLAGNNELVALRAAGVSLYRITWAALKAGLLLVVCAIVIGEWGVAASERQAQEVRSSALAGHAAVRTEAGFWTRDGNNFINVRAVLPDGRLVGVYIYEFDSRQRLLRVSSARSATYKDGHWALNRVARSQISGNRVVTAHPRTMSWTSQLNPALLEVIAVHPGNLSISGLYRYIGYLRENGLSSARYEIEFWSKLALPFATALMVFLSVPFVFGPLRSSGAGQRIVIGVLVGTAFYLFNQMVGYVGLVYGFSPALSALAPTVLFFIAALYLMRRVY